MEIQKLFNVSKKVVIITGVAGQLGSKYAQLYAKNGAYVAGLDILKNEEIDNLENIFPNNFSFFKCDITNKKSVIECSESIISVFGSPQILVNNAAIDSPPSAPVEENCLFETYPENSWERVMNVNLKGSFICCQVF